MSITISDCFFVVAPVHVFDLMMAWEKKNPKASINERVAKKREFAEARREQAAKIVAAGYPKERRFQHKEIAERYAAEVERETQVKMKAEERSDIYL